jgi:methylisocitrate lyase
MLQNHASPGAKRSVFRAGLRSGELLRFPGAFSPQSARIIERHRFEGVYASDTAVSADLGLTDIGLTLPEFARQTQRIARVMVLPVLADAGAVAGEPTTLAALCTPSRTPAPPG